MEGKIVHRFPLRVKLTNSVSYKLYKINHFQVRESIDRVLGEHAAIWLRMKRDPQRSLKQGCTFLHLLLSEDTFQDQDMASSA